MLTTSQLEARKKGIGGSDSAAVVGLNRYKTPLQVYLEKLGLADPPEINQRMYFGHVLEPVIVAEYEKRTNKKCSIEENTLIHPKFNWMLANIDRRVEGESTILECKATDNASEWGESGTDQIPTEYLLQCAHYAAVCDVERVDIAVLIGLKDFRIYHYYRNELLEAKLLLKEEEFWSEHILKNIPPVAKNYADTVKQWSVELEDKTSIATPEIENICYELFNKQEIHKKLQNEIDELKTVIATHMEDASRLYDGNGRLLATWQTQKRKSYFVKPSSTRIFKLKEL